MKSPADLLAGLCECGCGERTRPALHTRPASGVVKGQPSRFRPGHVTRAKAKNELEARFFARVVVGDECWTWVGAKNNQGYGRLEISGQIHMAHRWSYEYHRGPIPADLVLDHLCHGRDDACPGGRVCIHRSCVNPEHLEAVTGAENTRRGLRGERTHCSKGHEFTPENTRLYTPPTRTTPYRRCRECHRLASLELRLRKAAQASDVKRGLAATREADQKTRFDKALRGAK